MIFGGKPSARLGGGTAYWFNRCWSFPAWGVQIKTAQYISIHSQTAGRTTWTLNNLFDPTSVCSYIVISSSIARWREVMLNVAPRPFAQLGEVDSPAVPMVRHTFLLQISHKSRARPQVRIVPLIPVDETLPPRNTRMCRPRAAQYNIVLLVEEIGRVSWVQRHGLETLMATEWRARPLPDTANGRLAE